MEGILESMLNQICGADLFDSIYETLAINLFSSGGAYSGVYSAVRSLYNSIMPIGVMMMFIYFMIALVDKLSSETFTWEQFFRQLAMVLAAKFLMEHGFEILETLFGIGLSSIASQYGVSQWLGENLGYPCQIFCGQSIWNSLSGARLSGGCV